MFLIVTVIQTLPLLVMRARFKKKKSVFIIVCVLKEPKQISIISVSQVTKNRATLSSKLYLCSVAGPAFLEFHLEAISKDWVPGLLFYKPNPLAALH